MPEVALAQVEDRLKDILEAHPPLAQRKIITDQSLDIALDEYDGDAIIIYTTQYQTLCAYDSGRTEHLAEIEFEVVSRTQSVGTISRANHTAIAHIMGAIAPDRTLGNFIEWIEEVDVAPAEPRGKDASAASFKMRARFYTPQDDWFTIVN